MDDFLNGFVGFVVCLFDFAGFGAMAGIWAVGEQSAGERTGDAFVEQDEQRADFASAFGEVVAIGAPLALDQAVGFEFAHVVAQLGRAVCLRGQVVAVEDEAEQIARGETAGLDAGVQQRFHEPAHARIVDFDAGHGGSALLDGLGQFGEQVVIDVDIERGGLGVGEAVQHAAESLADGAELDERLFQGEVLEVVRTDFLAQEGSQFLVLLDEGVFEVGAQHGEAMLQVFQARLQFAPVAARQARPEDARDDIGGKARQGQFARALKQRAQRQRAAEEYIFPRNNKRKRRFLCRFILQIKNGRRYKRHKRKMLLLYFL